MKRGFEFEQDNSVKKVKTDDKIDPIEKLLSLNNNYDLNTFLNDRIDDEHNLPYSDSEEEQDSEDDSEVDSDDDSSDDSESSRSSISVSFNKIITDNLRYHQENNFYSSFSSMNNYSQQQQKVAAPSNQVPFFKNVNFNPKPNRNLIDEIIDLGDDEIDPKETVSTATQKLPDSEEEEDEISTPKNSPLLANSKMVLNYRNNNALNLSNINVRDSNLRILNENSLISGKLNETIGSGKFLINDFFL